jgi:hypothetical protein
MKIPAELMFATQRKVPVFIASHGRRLPWP